VKSVQDKTWPTRLVVPSLQCYVELMYFYYCIPRLCTLKAFQNDIYAIIATNCCCKEKCLWSKSFCFQKNFSWHAQRQVLSLFLLRRYLVTKCQHNYKYWYYAKSVLATKLYEWWYWMDQLLSPVLVFSWMSTWHKILIINSSWYIFMYCKQLKLGGYITIQAHSWLYHWDRPCLNDS